MRVYAIALLLSLVGLAGCASRDVAFKMHTINAESPYEGVGVLDVNRDGQLDILCGKYWYEAPDWKKHFVREIEALHGYHQTFSDLPLDVDGDGWTDTICVSWFNKRISWIRNPGKPDAPWEEITIDEPGNFETAVLADVNADGRMDVLPNIFNGGAAWYECHPDKSAPHGAKWTKHPLPKQLLGPGIGLGDINGDGRADIVGCKGWAEAPADVRTNPNAVWAWHGEFDLRDPGIPVLVHDVDGDGDADVIWGIGHDYGLYWLEQERNATGKRVWTQHEIDKSWSQAHVTLLGDVDGDGRQELVTGKRYHAHDTDPGAEDPRCLYWYKFDRTTRQWTRHVIQEGGAAGTGTSSALVDIDGDGDLDFVGPGKSGLFLFENLRIEPTKDILHISWDKQGNNDMLTIESPRIPGGPVEVWYLEAFCRRGSTDRDWNETTVPFQTEKLAADPAGRWLKLRTVVDGKVEINHELRAGADEVDIRMDLVNHSAEPVDIEWAQPCMRVGGFTGRGQDDYFEKCFIFTDQGLTRMHQTHRETNARYTPGQVYVPAGIDPNDVNPRPVSRTRPANGLVGCFSTDGTMILAMAFDHTQELFQGIITCIHSDFRIGGMKPGERKRIRGKIYIVPNDVDALLKRYQRDFPAGR